jgi:hypothetical protein
MRSSIARPTTRFENASLIALRETAFVGGLGPNAFVAAYLRDRKAYVVEIDGRYHYDPPDRISIRIMLANKTSNNQLLLQRGALRRGDTMTLFLPGEANDFFQIEPVSLIAR